MMVKWKSSKEKQFDYSDVLLSFLLGCCLIKTCVIYMNNMNHAPSTLKHLVPNLHLALEIEAKVETGI